MFHVPLENFLREIGNLKLNTKVYFSSNKDAVRLASSRGESGGLVLYIITQGFGINQKPDASCNCPLWNMLLPT